MLTQDNPEHDRLRRTVTRDFAVSRSVAKRGRIQEIVNGLIDAMLAGPKPVEFVETFALQVPSLVVCEMMGVPYEEHKLFQDLTKTMSSRHSTGEQAVAALNGILDLIRRVVHEKDNDPQDDMISRLVVEQMRTGAMAPDEVVHMCANIFFAGLDTTTNQIALSTLAFLRHPEALKIVRTTDDPDVIANAVEEMLRYLAIVQIGRGRVATEDFEFRGHQIKAGDGIIVAIDAANHDSDAFENPERLDLNRKSRHHIAFGWGIHQCLGQPLVRVELQTVYSTLFRRIPTLALAVPFDEIEFKDSVVYGIKALPVTW